MTATERITGPAFAELDLPDWRYLLGRAEAGFRCPSYAAAGALAARIAEAADELGHHPAVDIRPPAIVHVVTESRDTGGLSERDVRLAERVSALATEAGATPTPLESTTLEIAIDAMEVDAVRPFWAAVLGYEEDGHVRRPDGTIMQVVDPRRIGPSVWFQQMDEPRPQRNRVHVDVTVPHDVAEERVAAALAAGGRLVSDARARAFWVLADPEGNEACVCTWQGRDPAPSE